MLIHQKNFDIVHEHVMHFAASRLTAKPVWGDLTDLLAQIRAACEEKGLPPPSSDTLRAHIRRFAPEITRRYGLQNKPGRKKLPERVEVLIQETLHEAQPTLDDLKVISTFEKAAQRCAAEALSLPSYYIVRKRTEEYLHARRIGRPMVRLGRPPSGERDEDIPVLRHALKELDELRASLRHIIRTRQAKLDRRARADKPGNRGTLADHESKP